MEAWLTRGGRGYPEESEELLERAGEALAAVKLSLGNNVSLDAVALDLKEALDALGEITGEVTSEDILNNIFAGFCVGK